MTSDHSIHEQALKWAARTGDPEFDDWDAFVLWLEADPAHSLAYDELQLALEETVDALAAGSPNEAESFPRPANDNPIVSLLSGQRVWLGAAVAASLVLVASFLFWPDSSNGKLYSTAPGETLSIALADGSTVELAGGSRIAIIGESEREGRLEEGQALFTIRHDETDPFVLKAGTQTMVDAGTVFDVRLTGTGLDLAVAEGAVIVNPSSLGLTVREGHQAILENGRYRVSEVEAEAVGEWTKGRISFHNANPTDIAARLTAATGILFSSDGSAADMRLSGSISLEQVKGNPQVLEAILGVDVRRKGDTWVLTRE